VALDMSASFEGGTRWTSHFHMPTLLAVDIICARRGTAGLAHILLAHILCITSSFTADRTHVYAAYTPQPLTAHPSTPNIDHTRAAS
jgi:hypothetical protein